MCTLANKRSDRRRREGADGVIEAAVSHGVNSRKRENIQHINRRRRKKTLTDSAAKFCDYFIGEDRRNDEGEGFFYIQLLIVTQIFEAYAAIISYIFACKRFKKYNENKKIPNVFDFNMIYAIVSTVNLSFVHSCFTEDDEHNFNHYS